MPLNGIKYLNVLGWTTLRCCKCVRLLLNIVKFSCGKWGNLGVGTGGSSNEEGLKLHSVQRKPATQGHGELQRCAADWLGLQEAAGWEEAGRLPKEAPGGYCEFMSPSEELLQTNCRFVETHAVNMEAFPCEKDSTVDILVSEYICGFNWTFWMTFFFFFSPNAQRIIQLITVF